MVLRVSEHFYSLQGEGITMGVPSVFIRLQGCNLLCSSKEWECDTIEVWKKGEPIEIEDFAYHIHSLYGKEIRKGAHLIFTGGEPVIQQDAIVEFIQYYGEKYECYPFIEIETNGTKPFGKDLLELINLINCSPKTSNAGMELSRTIVPEVLKQIDNFGNSIFKFVIAEMEDIDEVNQIVKENDLWEKRVVLMPAADCQEQLRETIEMVAELCKDNCYMLSSRLQISIWNKTIGV